jgi:transcriptional regulator with XRE-family HTH domain
MVAEKRNPLGPTGETVRANVQRLREAQNLGYARLARILDEEIERPIPELGLRRIESGDRRVDVDDLVALAAALGVAPVTLLMPRVDSAGRQDEVESTAASPIQAAHLWAWLTANEPIPINMSFFIFIERSWPAWAREKYMAQVAAAQTVFNERVGGEGASGGDD